jgi:hypothetical protein
MKNPLQTFKRVTTRVDNSQTIIDSIEVVIKGNPDRKLYDISKIENSWIVNTYDNQGEHKTIETKETDSTISDYADFLIEKFNEGRILEKVGDSGFHTWKACENVFRRVLKRQQVAKLLRYERDGTPPSTHTKAVAKANPSLLPAFQDFGDYTLDTWLKTEQKRAYLYSTFNRTTKRHLDKLVFKY